jgi:ATP-dependent exoDNAse (exonuclease V) beta subunit
VPISGSADSSEERRLFYVALTRAEESVWCTWSRRRGDPSGGEERAPTPYLLDLGLSGGGATPAQDGEDARQAVRQGLRRLRLDLLGLRQSARHRPIPVPALGAASARSVGP